MATMVTKDKICEAAMQLAIRDGLLAMTLDNVAKQAGISKGGAARMRKRFTSAPNDGMEQILVWLAIDGLFLWQFVGLIDSNDPMIAQVGETLRARIRAKLEEGAVASNLLQGRLFSDAANTQRGIQ